MDLETVFYSLGIVYMAVTLFIYIAIAVALISMKKKVDRITDTIEEKIEFVQNVVTDPTRMAVRVGTAIASKALKRFRK